MLDVQVSERPVIIAGENGGGALYRGLFSNKAQSAHSPDTIVLDASFVDFDVRAQARCTQKYAREPPVDLNVSWKIDRQTDRQTD